LEKHGGWIRHLWLSEKNSVEPRKKFANKRARDKRGRGKHERGTEMEGNTKRKWLAEVVVIIPKIKRKKGGRGGLVRPQKEQ